MFTLEDVNNILLAGILSLVGWTVWGFVWRWISRASRESPQRQTAGADRREQHERARQERARRSPRVGALLRLLAVAIWPVGILAIAAAQYFNPDSRHTIVSGLVAVGVPITSGLLWRRGRQLRLAMVDEGSHGRRRPQILYLRPFIVDHVDRRSRLGRQEIFPKTNLERMERALLPIGDFVALGDPTDRLPPLGTKVVYPGDDRWQETVREMTSEASTIILPTFLIPEDASGFAWEIEHVIGLGAPEGVIFLLVPPEGDAVLMPVFEERYAAFRDRFGSLFPRGLPDAIGTNGVLYFEVDWTPRLLGYSGAPDVEVPDGRSGEFRALVLRQLKDEFGHPLADRLASMLQRRTPLQRTGIMVLLLVAGLLVLLLFLLLLVSLTLIGR